VKRLPFSGATFCNGSSTEARSPALSGGSAIPEVHRRTAAVGEAAAGRSNLSNCGSRPILLKDSVSRVAQKYGPSAASFNVGRGGRPNLVPRATEIVLINPPTFHTGNWQLRSTPARNCGLYEFEFFNRIGQLQTAVVSTRERPFGGAPACTAPAAACPCSPPAAVTRPAAPRQWWRYWRAAPPALRLSLTMRSAAPKEHLRSARPQHYVPDCHKRIRLLLT
jgi:hypothetical protein